MAGTALDYPSILKGIIDIAAPGNVSLANVLVAETLDDLAAKPNSIVISEGTMYSRDHSDYVEDDYVPVLLYCIGATRDAAQDVAQEARDALTKFSYAGTVTDVITATTEKSATSSTVTASPLRIRNRTPLVTGSTIDPWVENSTTVSLLPTFDGRAQVLSFHGALPAQHAEGTYTYSAPQASGTTELWVQVSNTGGKGGHLEWRQDAGAGYFLVDLTGDDMIFTIYAGNGSEAYSTTLVANYSTGAWYALKVSWNATHVNVWVNGIQIVVDEDTDTARDPANLTFKGVTNGTVYIADVFCSWLSVDEAEYLSFTFTNALPVATIVTSATLSFSASSIVSAEYGLSHPHVRVHGIEGTVGAFADVAEIAAYSYTSATTDSIHVASSNSIDVTTAFQENTAAGQLATAGSKTGFRVQCYVSVAPLVAVVATGATLGVTYHVPGDFPHRVRLLPQSPPRQREDGTWEIQQLCQMEYYGVSKVVA